MPSTLIQTTFLCLFLFNTILFAGTGVRAMTSYANDFVNPDYILARAFPDSTRSAQTSIANWATELAGEGPWSVMNKSVVPPTGDKHDYMSWAPYSWPDCSSVGNTTELSPEQIWKTCPYVTRDGQFNPDGRLINDVGSFQNLSDAVLYNAIAWAIDNKPSSTYSQNAVTFIKTWFLNNDTRMNPNLDFAQLARGPNGQVGQHTGVLDLKCMTKIASGILILRKGKCTDWTTDLDNQMNAWTTTYISWLETAKIAIEEKEATNNHGSFYYNQLASLKILVNDIDGAQNVTRSYFSSLFQGQISANGEQPLEAARTRPYHYRAYNLAAMITSARLAKFADSNSNLWNATSSSGGTIQKALDFAMTISASASSEDSYASELYPSIGAVAAVFGDPQGKYAGFLKQVYDAYPTEAWFLWNQPLSDSGYTGTVTPSGTGQPKSTGIVNQSSGARRSMAGGGGGLALVLSVVVAVGFWSAIGC